MRHAFKAVDFGASIVFHREVCQSLLATLLQRTTSSSRRNKKDFLSLKTRHRWSPPR